MIFVTVGTEQPFDRLVKVVDRWVGESGRQNVFAQIGEGGWEPAHVRFANFLQPPEFMACFQAARLIVSHAGMGTILSAMHYGKPILVMPKRASMGEHRSEHQLATARRMMELGRVHVAFDESELRDRLEQIDSLTEPRRIGSSASDSLLAALSSFLTGIRA